MEPKMFDKKYLLIYKNGKVLSRKEIQPTNKVWTLNDCFNADTEQEIDAFITANRLR